MAKDAKGHGSEKRGGGGGAPKTPTLHEEANMRTRSAGGMSPDQIAAHPDFGGRYNVPTVNAVVADKQAANELGQGHPKSGAVPVHGGATGPSMADFVKNMQAGQREDSNVVRNRAGKRAYGSRWRSKDRTF